MGMFMWCILSWSPSAKFLCLSYQNNGKIEDNKKAGVYNCLLKGAKPLWPWETFQLLVFLLSRWDGGGSYQCSRLPGARRHSTHTCTLAGMDGSANQPSRLGPRPRLLASLPPQCYSLWAPQSVERISLHLCRKHWRGVHFSISLCTYIHSVIKAARSNQPYKHALRVCEEYVDKDREKVLWWDWRSTEAWCVNDSATGVKTGDEIMCCIPWPSYT